MEQDWFLLDEDERARLVEPYEPVSPGWRYMGWAAFWVVTAGLAFATGLLFSFSDQVEDWLLLGGGAAAALALVSILIGIATALRHRREMAGPYEEPSVPGEVSTQMGTSRPARAT